MKIVHGAIFRSTYGGLHIDDGVEISYKTGQRNYDPS